MEYLVRIAESALQDAENYTRFIRDVKGEPGAASRWFNGLVDAVLSLENQPSRCPLIPESTQFPFELRHLIYHSHRIIFRIIERNKQVIVLRVYHGSRHPMRRAEIKS